MKQTISSTSNLAVASLRRERLKVSVHNRIISWADHKKIIPCTIVLLCCIISMGQGFAQKKQIDYVNPFIGTSNFGTCNPGALVPHGLMSVTPFNVMGSDLNQWDKDKRWWSTPYSADNVYLTGFSHVNLSGVGCPDLGSLLLMATSGNLCADYMSYGTQTVADSASPGYYATTLERYGIRAEMTATQRTSRVRFAFPAGKGNILFNLGEGLTNESGAMLKKISDTEFEGCKLFGNFCYIKPDGVFPLYFCIRVSRKSADVGYWKKQRPMEAEAAWDSTPGTYKYYRRYAKELAGDDIGCFFSYDFEQPDTIEVQVGISLVSTASARRNLIEQEGKNFETVHELARSAWQNDLSRIEVEGGTEEERTIFYTALYHLLIHPSVMQDVDGNYPAMESDEIRSTSRNHYTIFSLWDTYRGTHPLLCLLFPDRQTDMVRSLIDKYETWGWLPKWELCGRETGTMDGDPATIMIADTYARGLRDFNIEKAYEACRKSAFTPGQQNSLRPDLDIYASRGYLPIESMESFAVSTALEYYLADYTLARFAEDLGHDADATALFQRAEGWKNYFDTETLLLRPRMEDGSFLSAFNPLAGQNFEANPGFHEGCAWNYTFCIPFDIEGLAQQMGGKKTFINRLWHCFEDNLYDPANEPDISYPYFFSRFEGEQWRTQELTQQLLKKHFRNAPDGLPGNEDTGAMSAWAIYSMIGLYPDCPGEPTYTLTTPIFDRVTIHLDPQYYPKSQLVIEKKGNGSYIRNARLGTQVLRNMRISHADLTQAGTLTLQMKAKH
ncbi:MAG: GH92 family glycosyl hydrolase [Bacteroidaceae bacterium]|nr:GH92 family glycosyl hydrolase [Bacteroidaceae bacterium]